MEFDNSIYNQNFAASKSSLGNQYQEVLIQLETIKEKLRNREKETTVLLKKQRDDHEAKIKQRDEEITAFFNNLLEEKNSYKKKCFKQETEIAALKEKLEEYSKNQNDDYLFDGLISTKLHDKQIYSNIKYIKEQNENKLKELDKKYEALLKNLNKEHKFQINNFKKMSFDNKIEVLNNREEEYLSINQVEEYLMLYENKIKVLYDEVFNKEKYILLADQKYDMINEENKFLKRKINEEKHVLLKKIEEIESDKKEEYNELVRNIEKEIREKKNSLQEEIEKSLEKSEKLVNFYKKEKDKLKEENDELAKEILEIKTEVNNIIQEREEMEAQVLSKENTLKEFEYIKSNLESQINMLNSDKDNMHKLYTEIYEKYKKAKEESSELEIEKNKLLRLTDENVKDKITREYDIKYKGTIDSLNLKLIELEQRFREIDEENKNYKEKDMLNNKLNSNEKNYYEEELGKVTKLLKKEKSDKEQEINELNTQIINLRLEANENLTNYRMLSQTFENQNTKYEKCEKQLENAIYEKEQLIEKYGKFEKKAINLENENKKLSNELAKLSNENEELANEVDDLKKNLSFKSNELESIKAAQYKEINRLKMQMGETEKVSDKASKGNIF